MKAIQIGFEQDTSLRVRYEETDQMGYVYYGNYAQYFEVGRVETMRKMGLSYRALEEKGFMLPVRALTVNYFKAATFDDLIIIRTNVVSLTGVRLLFEYSILKDEEILCKGTTELIFVKKETMKPVAPPSFFIDALVKITKD